LETLQQFGPAAIFVALLLAPFGFPVPEDVSLLVLGVLVAKEGTPYLEAFLVAYFGVLIGDTAVWGLGRRIGLQPTGWVARLSGQKRIEWIERFYARYGAWAIVFCRQVPGLRFPGFFFAGATDVSLPRFLVFDGCAALVTANLYLLVGGAFADDLDPILDWMSRFRVAAGILMVSFAVVLAVPLIRTFLAQRAAP
jgi:membrane protein DedA with SNARE-associated domain